MAHYAKVNQGIVEQVIVAEADFFDTFIDSSPGNWIQTSYNTVKGVHLEGGTPLRKNYADVGGVYDSVKDAFYTQQPYASWVLNEDSCIWESPVGSAPTDGKIYDWNEATTNWVEVSK